jgi:hypothetical protein
LTMFLSPIRDFVSRRCVSGSAILISSPRQDQRGWKS